MYKLVSKKEVHIDHIEECGSLRSFDDIQVHRTINNRRCNGYQVLCKTCHTIKSNETRYAKKALEK
jgi:hypothetical protein